MAEPKKNGDFPLQSTGVFALVLAVIGLIWTGPLPLFDERPASHMKSDFDKGQIQDVDARMWQDPLGAVEKEAGKVSTRQSSVHLEQTQKNELKLVVQEEVSPEKGQHSPENLFPKAFNDGGKPTVDNVLMLAVLIPGGPYPEEEEGRRRKRYAVLSALATLNYVPKETEHIGYFKTGMNDLPEIVPFELFENAAGLPRKGVIVLWLNDSKFDEGMDEKIKKLFGMSKPRVEDSKIKYAVIGPNKSNQLKAFIRESSKTDKPDERMVVAYFAAGATAKPLLLGDNITDPLTKTYHPANNLLRTIGNDGMVSDALVKELGLRQVNPQEDHVLLISEWDTFYGQVFPQTFTQAYTGDEMAKCLTMTHRHKNFGSVSESNVYCINYMRGIDGLLPDETTGKNESAQEAQKKPETIQINNNIDRPSGNYQQDYLRRLVDRVRKLDKIIRDSKLPCPVKNNGITAIGVVGSDVYDKLMILQALRPYFPGKIFFTTDLDAAYFSDREQQFTHNLIVGSSFGLSLAPELQMSIPPFRDSYQTAVFFSTKLAASMWENGKMEAIGNNPATLSRLNDWLSKPRIFEIGRKSAVDLSQKNDSFNLDNCQKDILDCALIHPTPDSNASTHTAGTVVILKLSAFVLGLLLLYRMNWMVRDISDKLKTKLLNLLGCAPRLITCLKKSDLASMTLFVATGMLTIAAAYVFVTVFGRDEPFSWLSGVSIWPSNLLQLLALLISLWALYALNKQLAKTDQQFGEVFLKLPKTASGGVNPKLTTSECILAVHKWKVSLTVGDKKLDVNELWQKYVEYGQTKYRNMRAAMGTIFFVLFGFAAIMLSGGQPIPSRGDFSFYTDVTLETLCVFAIVFLIMWVVDAARLISRLIDHLANPEQSKWPCIGQPKWGWPQECNDYASYWLDVKFVAQYTKAMENFIWYPIPPLLLLGAARSSVFDNWTFSPGLLASIIILLIYLFSIAFILQRAARDMRKKAEGKLEDELRNLCGNQVESVQKNNIPQAGDELAKENLILREAITTMKNKEGKITQLEKMIAEIKNNEEGAFTPFLHQPLVQALLTFLGGSGGLIILMERFF